MVTERINLINKILEDKPTRLRESFFIKNYNELYKEIISFSDKIKDLPFKQKIWHWVNDIKDYNLCICGSELKFHRNWKDGYRLGCSPKCAQSHDSVKNKRRKTTFEKYGVSNVAKNEKVKNKMKSTNIERYGTESSFQNEKVKEKYKKTIQSKYGVDHYFQTNEFKKKAKIHYLKKYGVDHQLKVKEIVDKIKSTCVDKYGVETYLNTDHSRNSIKKFNRSSQEKDICKWLESLGIEYKHSYRGAIKPYLLDIYIPEHKLAIEFNGLYWHSEFYKEKTYHYDKTKMCKDEGIHLIHIWEDDWLNREEVLKSILLNKMGLVKDKIWARKCSIKELDNTTTSKFLNSNHIQGYSRYSISYGLYYNNDLISVMTFGWRSTNGQRKYELIRFCNKLNINVIGGASKLFKHFLKMNPDVDEITSFTDISLFEGGVYKKLGFIYKKHSSINYWWVVNGVRKHRFNYNKKKLVKMGCDPLKTEIESMHEMGNYRVFGCGQDKYIYNRVK